MAFKSFTKLFISALDFQSPDAAMRIINQLQGNIQSSFGPLVGNIQNDSQILENITLTTGINNVVNHKLGRNLKGWKLTRIRSQANVYDTQDNNPSPNLTLWLTTNATVVVDIEVF